MHSKINGSLSCTIGLTRFPPRFIVFATKFDLPQDMFLHMADSEISKLEQRIDELIVLTEQLSNENTLMRERQDILVEERARLIEKGELARSRVEAMLVRLKAMETET